MHVANYRVYRRSAHWVRLRWKPRHNRWNFISVLENEILLVPVWRPPSCVSGVVRYVRDSGRHRLSLRMVCQNRMPKMTTIFLQRFLSVSVSLFRMYWHIGRPTLQNGTLPYWFSVLGRLTIRLKAYSKMMRSHWYNFGSELGLYVELRVCLESVAPCKWHSYGLVIPRFYTTYT